MASAVIGALRVNLGLDSAEFQNGLKNAEKSTSTFGKGLKVAFTAVAAAGAAALATLAVSLKNTLASVDDIAKRAQVSNTSFESFQRLAYAARTVGIEADKLADIFKDVNDRIGDFSQTGGGPMADFFENIAPKVGVTIDAFKRLSGPEALQLYYDSLQKAGVNQQQMTFYLEAMASDVTALIPLLEQGGEGFRKLGEGASVISGEDGARLSAFNQSMRDLGQAFSDVALAAVASLAPALSVVAAGFDAFSGFLRQMIQYLPTVAEYAAVAAGSLAIMAAPAIVASVLSLAAAIKVGLVGALALLKTAILANPLGALAIGIAVAVTAIYHFRDEIQKAIGVDVVQVVKTAANFVINSFRAAFADIQFVWENFGDIMGAAVTGGVNAAIRAINGLIEKAAQGIDWLIEKVNSIPGVDIPLVGGSGGPLSELDNPYGDRLGAANDAHSAAISDIMSSDPIGALGAAFEASTPAALNFASAVNQARDGIKGVSDAINGGEKSGGGGAGGGAAEGMLSGLEQLRQSLMTAEEAERNSYANRLIAIQEYFDAGLIQKAEYDDLTERAHQEHTDRMAEITRRGVEQEMRMRGQVVGNLSSVMGSLSSILEKTGDKNLAAAKAFAVAEAVINTAQGITKALAQGGMFGFAGAAAVAAAGAAQIATILSANKGSSRRPAVSGSGASSGSGEATRNDTPSGGTVNLQIQGLSRDELYSGEQVRELMDRMVELQRDGYQLVVVDT